jgi:hypothetical protein
VDELGAALDHFRIQTLEVVDPEVGVEHVRGDDLAVRSRGDAVVAGEVDVAAVSTGVAVGSGS